jgi:hypothetical protein
LIVFELFAQRVNLRLSASGAFVVSAVVVFIQKSWIKIYHHDAAVLRDSFKMSS